MRARFAAALLEHLNEGTRPATVKGEPWTFAEFAREIPGLRGNDAASERAISNWCKGTFLPTEIEPILRALFGPRENSRHAEARQALRAEFLAARAEKIEHAKRDPAGPHWVATSREFVIGRTARASDEAAAMDTQRQQLQIAICGMAAELADSAKRLVNTRTWGRLSRTAASFYAVVAADPLALSQRLGEAYPLLLRLGRFLETDIRVQHDNMSIDDPLDVDIYGLLIDLVRTAAPWLRGFPTIAAWDDAAGKQLVRVDLFQPAHEFTRIARAQEAISERDAIEMDLLGETADASDYQGQKAGNRFVGGAQNLMLAAAEVVATFLSGAVTSDFTTRSLLVQRAKATLAAAETQVEAFTAVLPSDLGHALRALAKEVRRLPPSSPPVGPDALDLPVPNDAEEQVKVMILNGRAPPAAWRPFIRHISFVSGIRRDSLNLTALQTLKLTLKRVTDVTLLADLTALQTLSLWGTGVSDVAPLAGLTMLQDISLRDTRVSDVAPLAGLTALKHLDLTGTRVSDIVPLGNLAVLQRLDLTGTRVRDLAPLVGMSALQCLNLTRTRVSNVVPLANLTTLQELYLTGTRVSDVAPLAGLTALQNLNLWETQVSDVTALAGLTALQNLNLTGTDVSDMAPLAGLTALQHLNLNGTRVSDVTPLAGLTALQRLDLNGTQVKDVAPLAGLTNLLRLDLAGTRVSDVTPLAHIRNLKISHRPPSL